MGSPDKGTLVARDGGGGEVRGSGALAMFHDEGGAAGLRAGARSRRDCSWSLEGLDCAGVLMLVLPAGFACTGFGFLGLSPMALALVAVYLGVPLWVGGRLAMARELWRRLDGVPDPGAGASGTVFLGVVGYLVGTAVVPVAAAKLAGTPAVMPFGTVVAVAFWWEWLYHAMLTPTHQRSVPLPARAPDAPGHSPARTWSAWVLESAWPVARGLVLAVAVATGITVFGVVAFFQGLPDIFHRYSMLVACIAGFLTLDYQGFRPALETWALRRLADLAARDLLPSAPAAPAASGEDP